MGVLRDRESGKAMRSVLAGTRYLPSLKELVWEKRNDGETPLDKPRQLFFRRHRMNCQILKYPSDPRTKYDLFQRLNRGGEYATEQEVRTCAMVLSNSKFTKRLRRLADRDEFKSIFRITLHQKKQQRDVEYAVRLLVHSHSDMEKGRDVHEFLDNEISRLMDTLDLDAAIKEIEWVIPSLYRTFGEDALTPKSSASNPTPIRKFSLPALEGIAAGIVRNRKAILRSDNADDFIRRRIESFWAQ